MIDLHRRRVSTLIIEMARDDPNLVLGVIKKLKRSGEIEADELIHVERIARRQWVRIARNNLKKAQR